MEFWRAEPAIARRWTVPSRTDSSGFAGVLAFEAPAYAELLQLASLASLWCISVRRNNHCGYAFAVVIGGVTEQWIDYCVVSRREARAKEQCLSVRTSVRLEVLHIAPAIVERASGGVLSSWSIRRGDVCGLGSVRVYAQHPAGLCTSESWPIRSSMSRRPSVDRATVFEVYRGIGLGAPKLAPKAATSSWARRVFTKAPPIDAPNLGPSPVIRRAQRSCAPACLA